MRYIFAGQEGAEGRPRYGLLGIFLSVQLAASAAAVAQESAATAVTALRRAQAAGGEGGGAEGQVEGEAAEVGSGGLLPVRSKYRARTAKISTLVRRRRRRRLRWGRGRAGSARYVCRRRTTPRRRRVGMSSAGRTLQNLLTAQNPAT